MLSFSHDNLSICNFIRAIATSPCSAALPLAVYKERLHDLAGLLRLDQCLRGLSHPEDLAEWQMMRSPWTWISTSQSSRLANVQMLVARRPDRRRQSRSPRGRPQRLTAFFHLRTMRPRPLHFLPNPPQHLYLQGRRGVVSPLGRRLLLRRLLSSQTLTRLSPTCRSLSLRPPKLRLARRRRTGRDLLVDTTSLLHRLL